MAVILILLAVSNGVFAESTLCSNILYLIEQSKTGFAAIRRPAIAASATNDTSFLLRDASHCGISEDAEKTAYQCTWTHPRGEQGADQRFQQLVEEMRRCIGESSEERVDRAVNHPDFYASHVYRFRGGEASIALKNKSEPWVSLVSVGIDRFKTKE